MKVYVTAPVVQSRSIGRVAEALARWAPPSVEIVQRREDADLIVLHVIGRLEHLMREAVDIEASGKRFALMQYVLRSTQRPCTMDWRSFWSGAAAIWSYYDLPALIAEDGGDPDLPTFYHAPLGVDGDVFKPVLPDEFDYFKTISIVTSGQSWLTESVRECVVAAERAADLPVLHLGPELDRPKVNCMSGITDEALAFYYTRAQFVSGLRRVEGFELPAAEGLLCGARPILFDRPHYRQWYDGFGEFIPEGSREQVIESLVSLFKRGARPVTADERAAAAARFHWPTLVKGFFERCA